MCARRFDQVAHLGPLVAGEIVHDDNVARPQRRGEKLLDVSFEDLGVDRPIEDEWADNSSSLSAATKVVVFQWP